MTESTDPYTYPGTSVLRNLRAIRDPIVLAQFEAESTIWRIAQLIAAPLPGLFDTGHLKAIHKHIFQDVYSCAGQFRTVNISKGGHLFGAAAFVQPALQNVLAKLSAEGRLKGTDPAWFAKRAGFYLGEINAVHAFREGNGRAQREFIRELGLEARFMIDWSRATRDRMIAASRQSFETGDSSGLESLVLACIRD
jgi:cell filamentation protein